MRRLRPVLAQAAAALAAITLLPACTHFSQTSGDALPERMHVGEFSFDRPQGEQWYLNNISDPPTIVEFTKRGHQTEAQILAMGFRPPTPITTADQLTDWAENLPDADKVITPAPGHGAICVRYHGRSTMSINYADTTRPVTSVMTTDEDSLECIDPNTPNILVRFITTQRSATGGTQAGSEEAVAFLNSIRFEGK
ncbi:MAG: hypothetical protein ACLQDV_03560 [Candidatus Binataceae bacterium]